MIIKSIGVGLITHNSPERLKQSSITVPDWIENFVIVNDGTPYEESIYPKKAKIITHEINKSVGASKNTAIKYLTKLNCEHIFLMEDDALIKNENVFEQYIEISLITGLKHLNYALHGSDNKINGNPQPTIMIDYPNNVKIDLYHHCLGAFSYYHKSVFEKIGLFDEYYKNAWEHVDHTYLAYKNGLASPFWYFADIHNSWEYLSDVENCFETSTIRQNQNWDNNIKRGALHFYNKYGYNPTMIPIETESNVISFLRSIL